MSDDIYSSPDAAVGPEAPSEDEESDWAFEPPTGFGDTLSTIVGLYPKVLLRTIAYLVLFGVVGLAVVGGLTFGLEGVVPARRPGSALSGVTILVMGVVALVGLGLVSYFWSLWFTHIDNVFRGADTGGEFSDAADVTLAVAGVFVVKFIFMGLCQCMVWAVQGVFAEIGPPGWMFVLLTLVGALVLTGIYLFIHFADLAVIADGYSVSGAFSRATELVGSLRNFGFALGWFVLWYLAVAGVMIAGGALLYMGTDGGNVMAGGLLEMLGGSVAVMGLQAVVQVLLWVLFLVVNYTLYRALEARSGGGRYRLDAAQL